MPEVFKKDEFVTVPKFAKTLGISVRQAYYLVEFGVQNGGVLAFRFGRRCLRIPKTEIERYKQSRIVEEV